MRITDRNILMQEMRKDGYNYRQIGEVFGISRQRVHQIIGSDGQMFIVKSKTVYKRHLEQRPGYIYRFLRCILIDSGCWKWTGYANPVSGYGVLTLRDRQEYAHRLSYQLFNSPIPEGMHVLHNCDNPVCVNPDHLYEGTHKDNMRDRDVRGNGNGMRKLKPEDIPIIRQLSKQGDTGLTIAKRFSVSEGAIYSILQGRTWKWVK